MAAVGQGTSDSHSESEVEGSGETPIPIAKKINFFEDWSKNGGKKLNTVLRDTKTVKVDNGGKEVAITGCKVTFEKGTFTDAQDVTVTTEIIPENCWPTGREAATPMLHVDARSPLGRTTAKLDTWVAYTGQGLTLEVMHRDDETEKWESVQLCSISESQYIELDVKDNSRIIAVLRRDFSTSHIMRPIVYCFQSAFVITLLRDAELDIQKIRHEMKKSFAFGYEEKVLSSIECREDDNISTSISCVKPATGFVFFPDSVCIHSVREIIKNSTIAYQMYHLISDRRSASDGASEHITIGISLERNEKSLPLNCFSFCWNGDNKGGTPGEHRDPIYKSMVVNNFYGGAIGTLNFGEMNIENRDSKFIVAMIYQETKGKDQNCEKQANAGYSDEKRKVIRKADTVEAAGFVNEQQQLNGNEDIKDLLYCAECELYLTRGREGNAMEKLKDYFLKYSSLSASDVKSFGGQLARCDGRLIAAMILLNISHEMRKEETKALPELEDGKWRKELLRDIRSVLELSVNRDSDFHKVAAKHALITLKDLERPMTGAHEGLKFAIELYAGVVKLLMKPFRL